MSGKLRNQENGEFDARNYSLVQDFDPRGLGDGLVVLFCLLAASLICNSATSKVIVTVEMEPPNVEHSHHWYQEEHLDLLSRIHGYRKSSRYVLGPATPLTLGEPEKFLAIHELDSSDGLAGSEGKVANKTNWTMRMRKESSIFIART